MSAKISDYDFILVGANHNIVPLSYGLTDIANLPETIVDPQGMFKLNIGANINYAYNYGQNHSVVKLVSEESDEMASYMSPVTYNRTSMMSLDGLMSPVSLYPTPYNSTFHITKYNRSQCPWCRGAGFIKTKIPDARLLSGQKNVTSQISKNVYESLHSDYDSLCFFCVPDAHKQEAQNKSASPSEVFPPYLIASGTDNDIIDTRDSNLAGSPNRINSFTLNPIVLSDGEFSCAGSKQDNDNCVHSIDVVALGEDPGNVRSCVSEGNMFNSIDYLNRQVNHRFFALRGPIMIHSWGYDKEGYPVPNSSGEFKINSNNQIEKDSAGNFLYKNQEQQSDGTYSDPYKERTFRKGWASLPATWPVGPLDLRWDENAGVWTVGSNYKAVWVTIENSLFDSTPVRGVIEDSMSDAKPLPNNQRRLIFVKDPTGLFRAPRGAALYCKYNTDNGFYEPIYNQPFISIGTIRSTKVADIENTYTINYTKNGIKESFTGEVFDNPLNLPTINGRKGIFSFIGGKWTLTNVA